MKLKGPNSSEKRTENHLDRKSVFLPEDVAIGQNIELDDIQINTESAEKRGRSRKQKTAENIYDNGTTKNNSSAFMTPVAVVKWRSRSTPAASREQKHMQNKQTNNWSSNKTTGTLTGGLFAPVAAVKWRKNSKSRENKQVEIENSEQVNRGSNPSAKYKGSLLAPFAAAKWQTLPDPASDSRRNKTNDLSESSDHVDGAMLVTVAAAKWRSQSKSSVKNTCRRGSINITQPDTRLSLRRDSCPAVLSIGSILAPIAAMKWRSKTKSLLNNTRKSLYIQEETIPEPEPKVVHSILNNGFSSDFENTLKSLRDMSC